MIDPLSTSRIQPSGDRDAHKRRPGSDEFERELAEHREAREEHEPHQDQGKPESPLWRAVQDRQRTGRNKGEDRPTLDLLA